MAIYLVNFKNYEGEDSFELYRGRRNAIERFKNLRKKAKKKEEFYDEEEFNEEERYNEFSFFDPSYNEYSTYITFKTLIHSINFLKINNEDLILVIFILIKYNVLSN